MMDEANIKQHWPVASYKPQIEPDYAGNPFIEALPPIQDEDGAIQGMQNLIRITDAERERAPHERLHMLGRIKHFMQPLDYHVDLFHRMSVVLRRGYVDRNPLNPAFVRELMDGSERMKKSMDMFVPTGRGSRAPVRQRVGAGSGLTLLGPSGVGKSTAVEAVLKCYDQVIPHVRLEGPLTAVNQIVWLKLSIPPDGSLKALCMDFFEAVDEVLGTNYFRLYVTSSTTRDKLAVMVGRVAFIHGLGLLVIDELQNLNVAKSGGADVMMNFFKLLRDVNKVPVLTVGTPEAIRILSGDLQVARRNSGLEPMERMQNDEQFSFFCESLFDAQVLRSTIRPTSEIVNLLYQLSQGITDIVIQLFVLSQSRALSMGEETLSSDLLIHCYERNMSLIHPFLDDMRRGRETDGQQFDHAIIATKSASLSSMMPATSSVATNKVNAAPNSPTGVKARRVRKAKDAPSTCLLVRVVADGVRKQVSAHQALAAAGHVRALGAEALAQ